MLHRVLPTAHSMRNRPATAALDASVGFRGRWFEPTADHHHDAPRPQSGPRAGRAPVVRAGQPSALTREGAMSSAQLFGRGGRRRSPAAMPGHDAGRSPRNKRLIYPADPPTVDEIVAVTRQTPADGHGLRLRALIVVLWRGGLRIQEALSLIESDLDPRRGSILVRAAKATNAEKSDWTRGRGAIMSLHGLRGGSIAAADQQSNHRRFGQLLLVQPGRDRRARAGA